MATAALGSWPLWEKCNQHFVLAIPLLTTPHTHIYNFLLSYTLFSTMSITVFISRFGAFLESSLIFSKKYVHFSKQFVQTAPHNGFPTKTSNLLKIFSSSLKSKYLYKWTQVPSKWNVLVSLFTNKIVKMLNHVVNITVHTWCKLWQQFGWQLLLKCTKLRFLCMPYIHFKSTNVHITVCGILIERDCFKMFELLRIWLISQYLAAHFSHCNGPQ